MALVKYQNALQDAAGNGIGGALCAVTRTDTGASVALYQDALGAVPVGSNTVLTSTNPAGSFSFFVAIGTYNLTFTKGGVTVATMTAVTVSGTLTQFRSAEDFSADLTGATDSSAAFTAGLATAKTLHGTPSALLQVKDVVINNNQAFSGLMSRLSAAAGGTNLFNLTGFFATAKEFYLADGTALSGAVIRFNTGRSQRLRDVFMVNTGTSGIQLFPATGSCAVGFITNVFLEGCTGLGVDMRSSVNDLQVDHLYLSGKVDYDAGLGKPRAGSVGWKQNTPVIDGLAVGGHQIDSLTVISLQEGIHVTDGQYTHFGDTIADSCTSYGAIVDGASYAVKFSNLFVGTTLGIRISGSAQVEIDGLTTLLTGVVPPWGQTDFYDAVAPFYDVTVQNTATLRINGDAWRGDKRVFVGPTAKLLVSGGQWLRLRSGGTVAESTTTFLRPDGVTATEQDATFRVDRTGWLFLAAATCTVAPGTGFGFTYNIRVAGSMVHSVVIANEAFTNTSWAYAVPVTKGQEVSVQLVVPTGAGVARHECDVQLLPE